MLILDARRDRVILQVRPRLPRRRLELAYPWTAAMNVRIMQSEKAEGRTWKIRFYLRFLIFQVRPYPDRRNIGVP